MAQGEQYFSQGQLTRYILGTESLKEKNENFSMSHYAK